MANALLKTVLEGASTGGKKSDCNGSQCSLDGVSTKARLGYVEFLDCVLENARRGLRVQGFVV